MKFEYAKTKTMADIWPQKLVKRKDGYFVEMKNEIAGPFESKREADADMMELQSALMGWKDPEFYVGIIFKRGESYFVDRWRTEDGPFASHTLAQEHKDQLLKKQEEGRQDSNE